MIVDELARPRIGVVVAGDGDALTTAVVARVLTLAVLDRLPRARASVLVTGGAAVGSALDAGRPPAVVRAEDRRRCDLLLRADASLAVPGRTAGGGCPVVDVEGGVAAVAALARTAGGDDLRANRLATLRLLDWLPVDAPHVVVDGGDAQPELHDGEVAVVAQCTGAADAVVARLGAERCRVLPMHAGADEVIAAVVSALRYEGGHSLLRAIATPVDTASVEAALDGACRAAVECWRGRGAPGAIPDARPARRLGTQHAALRVALRMDEREREAAEQRAAAAETATQLVIGSRTWRYTERARGAYHAARRRLGR